MSKLNRKQIKMLERFVERGLNLNVLCDDDRVTLEQYMFKRKARVAIYVNGVIQGAWLIEPKEHRESKYFMPKILYRKVGRKKKREKFDTGCRSSDYASAGQALRYFNKVCDSVVIDEEKMSGYRLEILNEMLSQVDTKSNNKLENVL